MKLATGPTLSQFQSIEIHWSRYFVLFGNVDRQILCLLNCEQVGRVVDVLKPRFICTGPSEFLNVCVWCVIEKEPKAG